jgi:ankyrin repeat protein
MANMDADKTEEQKQLNIDLRQAMYSRDYAKAKRLIAAGADPNTRNGWGSPFIYWCAENSQVELIDFALEHGGDIDAVDKNGETALHKVAKLGRVAMIDHLLDRGAAINHGNIYKTTPLFVAARSNQPEAVKKLVDRGADPSIKTHKGVTAAEFAQEKGYVEVVELLESHP